MAVKDMTKEELSLYHRWSAMKARCNPNIKHGTEGKHYAYKGIRVCPEWQTWENFRDWAYSHGYSIELTLDRKNGDDDYYPDNCRWADHKTQANNISESALWERNAKKELTREKPRKPSKQQLELQRFSKWYADRVGLKEVPRLTNRFMRAVIEEGYYKPMYV